MAEDQPLFSIIIPVFNKDYALGHTLKSIQNQSFSDFEVLLIDDGSTDDSPKVCDRFHENDHRFVVVHKPNEGVSSARNLGLEMMRGKYVTFCDADDELPKDALASFAQAYEKSRADLIIGGFAYKNIKTSLVKQWSDIQGTEMFFSTSEINNYAEELWCENNMLTSCARLYVAKIIQDNYIRFNEDLLVLEDFDFVLSYLQNCSTVCTIKETTYYQVTGYGNDSFRERSDNLDNVLFVYNEFSDYLIKKQISITDTVMKEIYSTIVYELKRLANTLPQSFAEKRFRSKRAVALSSMDCVQKALNSVKLDSRSELLIQKYGIKNWLSGLSLQMKEIDDYYPVLANEKGKAFALLWKCKSSVKIYL